MNEQTPTHLYVGRRDAVIAEVGGQTHIYEGKYLVVPFGDSTWVADGCDTLAHAKVAVVEAKRVWPSIKVVWL